MGKELFEKRKKEFKEYVIREHRLPKLREVCFSDNEDMRLWFDNISKLVYFKGFIDEINSILSKNNFKVLSDKEKEQEFMNYINKYNGVPQRETAYFSDGSDMYVWYISYVRGNRSFEEKVHKILMEYEDFNLASVWSDVKLEFEAIIKKLKRVPEHREVFTSSGIDVRVIYDKLETFDRKYFEKLLLHLQSYNKNALSFDDRVKELLEVVSKLGYIPELHESRFSDGTDMFTWYNRKKTPELEEQIQLCIKEVSPKRKVNIYLIPDFKNKGGKFYTICANVGERLDLSNITSFAEAKKLDDTFFLGGAFALKDDEEIESVNLVKGRRKK